MDTARPASRPLLDRRYLQVALAAAFINTSYGTMSYSFSVLVTDSAAGGSLGKGAVSLGFGLALLVSGVAAIAAGTVADLFGSRRLLAGGAILGAIGLALFSACREPWQAILVLSLVIGPAMAASFYEPVYVLMNRWFDAVDRPRAYGVLTMLSGISITIFTPLTRLLVEGMGWRQAVLVLAVILLAIGTIVPFLLAEDREDSHPGASNVPRTGFVRESLDGLRHTSTRFWVFSAAFLCATAAFSGFSFHMIAQLEARGFDANSVAIAIGVTGIISLPARLFLPALTARFSASMVLAICLVLLGASAWVASQATAWWQVWTYVFVFGLVFGAIYPLRALVISERFAGPYFGRIIGFSALSVAVGRALGPMIVGLADSAAEYTTAFQVAGLTAVVGALVCWASMRTRPHARRL